MASFYEPSVTSSSAHYDFENFSSSQCRSSTGSGEISGQPNSSKTSSSSEYYPESSPTYEITEPSHTYENIEPSPTYEEILPCARQPGLYSCIVPSCPSQAQFRRLADLEWHQNTVHFPKFIDCPETWCGRTGKHGFTRKDHLRDHLREVHKMDVAQSQRLAGEAWTRTELTDVRSRKDSGYKGRSQRDSAISLADMRQSKPGYHRASVACVHCRRRKIKCLLALDDTQNRCLNCIKLKKECNFYPVDQQPPVERWPRVDSRLKGRSGETSTSSSSSPQLMGGHIIKQVDNYAHYPPLPVIAHAHGFQHSLAPSSSGMHLQNPISDQNVGGTSEGREPCYAAESASGSTTNRPSSASSSRRESIVVQMHHDFKNPNINAQQGLQSMNMEPSNGLINYKDKRILSTLIKPFEMPVLRLTLRSWLQYLDLKEPPLENGKTRIRYRCRCGKKVFGDYQELRPGAASEWQERLSHQFESKRNTLSSSEAPQRTRTFSQLMKDLITFLSSQGIGGKSSSEAPGLPLTQTSSEPDPIQRPNSQTQVALKFLLLCVKYEKWAIKLRHANVCNITSDVQLFRILAAEYRAARHRSMFSLRKLASINFLQFEALQKAETVGVRKVPDYPPESNRDYDYKPRPLDLIPPISENEMMHYFHCPGDALDIPLFLERMPMKLNGRLDLSGGYQTGWGLIFNDGISWKKVWIVSFFGMLSSAIAGLIWWFVRNDAQGASVIAAMTTPLVLVTLGAIQGYLDEID